MEEPGRCCVSWSIGDFVGNQGTKSGGVNWSEDLFSQDQGLSASDLPGQDRLVALHGRLVRPDSEKSHSGWVVLMAGAPVAWRSRCQTTVSLSTAEAELTAMLEGAGLRAAEERHLRGLEQRLGFEQRKWQLEDPAFEGQS